MSNKELEPQLLNIKLSCAKRAVLRLHREKGGNETLMKTDKRENCYKTQRQDANKMSSSTCQCHVKCMAANDQLSQGLGEKLHTESINLLLCPSFQLTLFTFIHRVYNTFDISPFFKLGFPKLNKKEKMGKKDNPSINCKTGNFISISDFNLPFTLFLFCTCHNCPCSQFRDRDY